jgi:hypothetical protein
MCKKIFECQGKTDLLAQDVSDVIEYDGSVARSVEAQLTCSLAAENPEIIGASI